MAETIITIKRRKGFTVLPNSTLRDNRLSLKTRAILAIMISMPDDWDYTVSGLAVICGVGRDAVRTSLRELEECGYLTRKQRHNENGHFGRSEYIVTEEPTTPNDAPLSERPSTGGTLSDNPTQQNKDCTNTPYSPPGGGGPPPAEKSSNRDVDWGLFEQFWAAYPRKQNKERARRAWKKINPDLALCRVMSAALKENKQSAQWQEEGGKYIPHPSTWLNGRRWEDEIKAPVSSAPAADAPLRGEGVSYL